MKSAERLNEEIMRMREKLNSLQDENSALKKALSDKEKELKETNAKYAAREAAWSEHLTNVSEAIEEAAEARLGYLQALEEVSALKKELTLALRSVRKQFD